MAGSAARIAGLGLALPPLEVAQPQALSFLLGRYPHSPAARAFSERVFRHPSVETRRFALDRLEDLSDDPDATLDRFRAAATDLGAAAVARALTAAGIPAARLDFLAVATCTGYLCPGLSSHVAEAAGLREDAALLDVTGMGCGAALPALAAARSFLAAHPGAAAAAVCVEVCSAALFVDDDPGLAVSNALFADGAAAAVLSDAAGPGPRLLQAASLHRPDWREALRFRSDGGRLRNVLTPDVPARAAEAMEALCGRLLGPAGLAPADVPHWALHPGGAKVLDAVRDRLGLPEAALAPARSVLRRFGNMSSPSCLFVLKDVVDARPAAGARGVLAAFGAGFSAHAALLEF